MTHIIERGLARLPQGSSPYNGWKLRENWLNGKLDRAQISDPTERRQLIESYIGKVPANVDTSNSVAGWMDRTWERGKLQSGLLFNQMREYWNAQETIGEFDEEDYTKAKENVDELVRQLQTIPQGEGLAQWSQDFLTNLPTLVGNLGVTIGAGWAGAKIGTATGVAVAPLFGPGAPVAPVLGAGIGFASGILAGLGVDSYMEGAVAFSDTGRDEEVAKRIREKHGDNPEIIEQAVRGVALEVAGNVMKKNVLNPANALVAVPFLKVPGKVGKSFLFKTGGLKYPNKLLRTKKAVMGGAGEFVQEATQEGIQEWERNKALDKLDRELGKDVLDEPLWKDVQALDWDRMLYAGSLGAMGGGLFGGLRGQWEKGKDRPQEQIRQDIRNAIESGDPIQLNEIRENYSGLMKGAKNAVELSTTREEEQEAIQQLRFIESAEKTATQEIQDIEDGIITDHRIDKNKTRYKMRVELLEAVQGGKRTLEKWIDQHKETKNPLAAQVVDDYLRREGAKNIEKVGKELLARDVAARTRGIEEFEKRTRAPEADDVLSPLYGKLEEEGVKGVTPELQDVMLSAISEKIGKGTVLTPEEIAFVRKTKKTREKREEKAEFKPLTFKKEPAVKEEAAVAVSEVPLVTAPLVEEVPTKKPTKRREYADNPQNVPVLARKLFKAEIAGKTYTKTKAEELLYKNFSQDVDNGVLDLHDLRRQRRTKEGKAKLLPTKVSERKTPAVVTEAVPTKKKDVEVAKKEEPRIKGVKPKAVEEPPAPPPKKEAGVKKGEEPKETVKESAVEEKEPAVKEGKKLVAFSKRSMEEKVKTGTNKQIVEVISSLKKELGEPPPTSKEGNSKKSVLQKMARDLIAKSKAPPKKAPSKETTTEEAAIITEGEVVDPTDADLRAIEEDTSEIREFTRFALYSDQLDRHLAEMKAEDRTEFDERFVNSLSEVGEVLPAYEVFLPEEGRRLANIDSALKRAGKRPVRKFKADAPANIRAEAETWNSIAGVNLRGGTAWLSDLDGFNFYPVREKTKEVGVVGVQVTRKRYMIRDRFGNPVIDILEYQKKLDSKELAEGDAIPESLWLKVQDSFVDRFGIYANDPKVILELKKGGYIQVPKAEIDFAQGVVTDKEGNPVIFDEITLKFKKHENIPSTVTEFSGGKAERGKALDELIAIHLTGGLARRNKLSKLIVNVDKGVWDSTKIKFPKIEEATTVGREEALRGERLERIEEEAPSISNVLGLQRDNFKPDLKGTLRLKTAINNMVRRLPDEFSDYGDFVGKNEEQLQRAYLGLFINSQREGENLLTSKEISSIDITELRESARVLKEGGEKVAKSAEIMRDDVDSAVAEFLAKGGKIRKIATEEIGVKPTIKETFQNKDEGINDFIEMLTKGRLDAIWVAPENADGPPILNAVFLGDKKTKPYFRIKFEGVPIENVLNFIEPLSPTQKGKKLLKEPRFKLAKKGVRGLGYADARLALDQFRKEFAGARTVDYKLFANPQEARDAGYDIAKRAMGATLRVENGFGQNEILIFHENIPDMQSARSLLFHESIVHYGMRESLGNRQFNKLLWEIVNRRPEDVRAKAEEINKGLGITGREITSFDLRVAAEEMLAEVSEGRANASLTQKILLTIKDFFHKLFGGRMNDAELRSIVIDAEQQFRKGTVKLSGEQRAADIMSFRGTPPRVMNEKIPSEVSTIRYSLSADDITSRRSKDKNDLASAPKWMTDDQKRFFIKMGPPHKGDSLRNKFEIIREDMWTKIRQGMFDRYASIKQKAGDRAYVLSRMSSSSDGPFGALFSNGRIFMDKEGAIDVDTSKKSFVEVMKPLGNELDTFLRWVGAKRAAQLKAEGRDALRFLTDDEIAVGLTLNEGRARDAITGKSITRKQLFDDVYAEFNDVQNSVLDIAEQAGVISAKTRLDWENKFYVPFYRVIEEDQSGRNGPKTLDKLVNIDAFYRLKGSDRGLGDLLQNTLMNMHHLIDVSLKNQAASETVAQLEQNDIAVKLGDFPVNPEEVADFKRRIRKGDEEASRKLFESDAKTIYVREGGKRVYYRIYDPLVLESLMSMNSVRQDNPLFKFFRGSKRWYTHAVTLSPEFRLANLMRDTISTMALAPVGVKDMVQFNPIFNVAKGWKAAGKKSKEYGHILAGGGMFRFGHSIGTDPDRARLLLKSGIKEEFVLDNEKGFQNFHSMIGNALKKGYKWYEGTGDRFESANRAALYTHLKGKGKSHLESSYEARDLMDFSLHGSWGAVQHLAQWSPFLNARLQGLYKMGRAASTPGRRLQFAAVTMMYNAASVMAYLAYKDDDDFKDREEWDRDTYHWFKFGDTAFRIPKAFELGAIATLAERVVEQMVDDEVHGKLFGERLFHTLHETFAIDPIPMPFRPMLDIYSNRNPFTDRPIESISMQRLSPAERRNAFTSEFATVMSRVNADLIPWERVQYSPVQIEYAVRGYGAWLGATTLAGVDSVFRMAQGKEAPEDGMSSIPIIGEPLQKGVRRFVVDLKEKRHTKYMTMFYNQMKEMNQVFSDIREMRQLGEIERAKDKRAENRILLRYRTSYNRMSRRLSKINNRIQRIANDPLMNGELKRQRINRLQQMKNNYTRTLVTRTFPTLKKAG